MNRPTERLASAVGHQTGIRSGTMTSDALQNQALAAQDHSGGYVLTYWSVLMETNRQENGKLLDDR